MKWKNLFHLFLISVCLYGYVFDVRAANVLPNTFFESTIGNEIKKSTIDIENVTLFDSLEFSQFSKKISNIFAPEKINSIISKLPAKYKIYGYDIGDINNDDRIDLVLSAHDDEDKKKIMDIYFFLNQDSTFSLVKTMQLKYYGEPIEVAFSIEKGVCYITRKISEYNWKVSGYIIENMIFRQVDQWMTRRLNYNTSLYKIGYDTYDNFQTLKSTEHFFRVTDNKTYLKASFYSLPVYEIHRHVPGIFTTMLADTSPINIISGSSSWFGKDDLAMYLSARFDSAFLFLHTEIEDDRLFTTSEADSGDVLELWFDISGKKKVDATNASYNTRDEKVSDVFCTKIAMGDNQKYSPSMWFLSERLKQSDKQLLSRVKFAVTHDMKGKHIVDIKFPMELFKQSLKNENIVGFTAAYHDVDNPLHPEWITTTATSDGFIAGNPKTFGALKFISDGEYYGDMENLNINVLIDRMRLAGILQ